jgi:hypothetical protein
VASYRFAFSYITTDIEMAHGIYEQARKAGRLCKLMSIASDGLKCQVEKPTQGVIIPGFPKLLSVMRLQLAREIAFGGMKILNQ